MENDFRNILFFNLNRILRGKIKRNVRAISFGYSNDKKIVYLQIVVDGKISHIDRKIYLDVVSIIENKVKNVQAKYFIQRLDYPNCNQIYTNFPNIEAIYWRWEKQIRS